MMLLQGILFTCLAFLSVVGVDAGCGTDNCLQIVDNFPWLECEVSTLCESFIHSTPTTRTVTHTATAHTTVTVPGRPILATVVTTITETARPVLVSSTETFTVTETASPPTPTIVLSSSFTITTTATSDFVCTSTVTSDFSFTTNIVGYVSRTAPQPSKRAVQEAQDDERDEKAVIRPQQEEIANFCDQGCGGARWPFPARLSSACACFLTAPTRYKTTTVTKTATATGKAYTTVVRQTAFSTIGASTVTVTVDATATAEYTPPPVTVTTSITDTVTVSISACTSTSTTTYYSIDGALTCGPQTFAAVPTASTSGSITCTDSVPQPSQNALFRIEGLQSGEGTIFEDCIVSGPRLVTTPSGGTHECDGTNDDANPAPGTTPTDMIDAAGSQQDFGFDGTFSTEFDDFFITSISATSETSDEFWGVLSNLAFTPTGGCGFESPVGTETEWIFDAFDYDAFLQVSPGFAAAQAGQGSVTVVVSTTDGNGGSSSPRMGASFDDEVSGSDGSVVVAVPSSPGCYQYKALQSGAAPSNGFFLAVLPDGTFN